MKRCLEPFSEVLLVSLVWFTVPSAIGADVSIAYPTNCPQLNFTVSKLQHALRLANETSAFCDLAEPGDKDILILADDTQAIFLPDPARETALSPRIKNDGFQIARYRSTNKDILCVTACNETGAMYGRLDLAEQIRVTNGLSHVEEKISNPRFEFRAIKFNLPRSSYRPSENPAMSLHTETCRSLRFWPPKPENYRIACMIRNEDFFILRWGQPDSIRKHFEINGGDYVEDISSAPRDISPPKNLGEERKCRNIKVTDG